jgi:hypothetical protein
MDEETKKRIYRMWEKYKDNKDVQFLLSQFVNLELKLVDADVIALCIDETTKKGLLDHRSLINDARLEYGVPGEYEFASKKFLSAYKERKEIF